jgi:hypothetical protein
MTKHDQWLVTPYVYLPIIDSLVGVEFVEFYVAAPPGMAYIMDATSLRLISDPNWRNESQSLAETHRRGQVNIRFIQKMDILCAIQLQILFNLVQYLVYLKAIFSFYVEMNIYIHSKCTC